MQFCQSRNLIQTPIKLIYRESICPKTTCSSFQNGDNLFARRNILSASTLLISLSQFQKQSDSQTLQNQIFDIAWKLDQKQKVLEDEQLAYTFNIPAKLKSGTPISFVFSRKPEKYSSAAPLTTDARQRIVCELVDFTRGLALTVFVGPVSKELMQTPVKDWSPKEVARMVLADRSNAKNSEGKRIPISQVETAGVTNENGQPYFEYEHIQQGSPNVLNPEIQTFRRALAVTTVRTSQSGKIYLYSFNVACPEIFWPDFEEAAINTLASFKLLPPGKDFVDPESNPLLFF